MTGCFSCTVIRCHRNRARSGPGPGRDRDTASLSDAMMMSRSVIMIDVFGEIENLNLKPSRSPHRDGDSDHHLEPCATMIS